MASEGAGPAVDSRLHRLSKWFDTETAAVVTIHLGLFQVLLSASLAYTDQSVPKLFILPLVLGIVIVVGGSFAMANERNPSRTLLCGCACSNALGLLGSLLAFCIFVYAIQTQHHEDLCSDVNMYYRYYHGCPLETLGAFSWSLTCLLLFYDTLAVIMLCLLSVSAFKTLKTE